MTLAAPVLDVPFVPQLVTNWCWAACASMVLSYYKQNIDQRAIAGFVLNTDCRNPDLWNVPCYAADILRIYSNWDLSASPPQGPLSSQALRDELEAGRPVE